MEAVLLARLAGASLAGGLLGGLVWLLTRRWRLPAAAQAWLWWAVCLKLVAALVLPALPLAVLPAVATPPPAPPSASDVVPASIGAATTVTGAATWAAPPPAARSLPGWRPVVIALWLGGVLAGALALGRRWRTVRGILRRATPVADRRTTTTFGRLCRQLGVRRCALRSSGEIVTPLVTGIRRPVVLLPAGRKLGDRELAMVLHHELQHLRRGDLWLGALPALAERLFFFHPVARLAAREYEISREAACDATVVGGRRARAADYGRLLLRLAGAPAVSAAAPAARRPTLRRRLQMLTQTPRSLPTGTAVALTVTLLLALAPLRLTARPAAVEPGAAVPGPAPLAVAEPAAAPAAEPSPGPTPEPDAGPQPAAAPAASESPAPAAATAPAEDSEAAAAVAVASESRARAVYEAAAEAQAAEAEARDPYGHGRGDEAWVLLGDEESWMHAGPGDRERAERWRQGDEPLLWFRRGGRAWVIRDPQLLAQVDRILAPQRELGRQQGELGERQGALGKEQGALGEQQGRLGAQQGELAERNVDLVIQQMELNAQLLRAERGEDTPLSRDEMRQRLHEIQAAQRELGERMGELGRQQGELGERQGELGRRQAELGEHQRELGQRQRQAAERAAAELRELTDRAAASGQALPAN